MCSRVLLVDSPARARVRKRDATTRVVWRRGRSVSSSRQWPSALSPACPLTTTDPLVSDTVLLLTSSRHPTTSTLPPLFLHIAPSPWMPSLSRTRVCELSSLESRKKGTRSPASPRPPSTRCRGRQGMLPRSGFEKTIILVFMNLFSRGRTRGCRHTRTDGRWRP